MGEQICSTMSVWSNPQAMHGPAGFSRHAPVEQKVPIMDENFLLQSQLNPENKVVCIRGFAGWHIDQLTLERANGEVDQVGHLFHDPIAHRNWPIGRVESRLDLRPDEFLTKIEYKSGTYGEHWGHHCRFHTDHGRMLEVKGSKLDAPGCEHSWGSISSRGVQITGFAAPGKALPEGRLSGVKTLPYPTSGAVANIHDAHASYFPRSGQVCTGAPHNWNLTEHPSVPPGLITQDLARVEAMSDAEPPSFQHHRKWPAQLVLRHPAHSNTRAVY